MECSDKNQLYIKKYESLVSEKYKEPVEGRFEDATADILRRINADHGEDEIVPEDEDSNSSSESDHPVRKPSRTLVLGKSGNLGNSSTGEGFTVHTF